MRTFLIATFIFLSLAPTALADATSGSGARATSGENIGTTLINPLNSGNCTPNGDCLMNFLGGILDFVIRIGTVVVILMMVFVGFKFVTAKGEPGEITKARDMLLWTVIGALILLGAKVIQEGITATVQALSTGG